MAATELQDEVVADRHPERHRVHASMSEPAPGPDRPPDLASFDSLRVARIRAWLDLRPDRRADVLAASELDEDGWDAIEERADADLLAAARRGDPAPLTAIDGAYLEVVEADRGAISVEQHACLIIADERGDLEAAARALGVPRGAFPRLARSWQRRAAADPAVAHDLRHALRSTR